jgi:lipopolysaccharide/colanic/teichoic acid biosynthesis glycosyltransferase
MQTTLPNRELVPVESSLVVPARPVYAVAKRVFDIVFAAVLLVVTLPVWIVTAILIRATTPGPIIFRQTRVGQGGRVFTCFKFRTMVADAEQRRDEVLHLNEMSGPVFKAKGDPRITRVGKWLRKTSIDELPQLINVLKGEMSVVGPRPPLPGEVAQYGDFEWRRLAVKPGLTCLWQVSGRSNIGFEQWVALDVEYIRRRGFWYDLTLVVRTVVVVILCRGAE